MTTQRVSLREANQHLAKYVEMAAHGTEIIVTKRGRPVARIAPIEVQGQLSRAQQAAFQRSQTRMQQGYSLGGESFDRETAHAR
ncbi:MAG: type II toxin-antitoxin system Phd/YefM family antitoxin [Acidithiobacillus sp.]